MTKSVTITADMPIQASSRLELDDRRGNAPVIVRSIPTAVFVDVHERQCQRNHGGQTLDRIRQRGGFSASEALAVLSCLHWDHTHLIKDEHAHYMLYSMISAFNRGSLVAERGAIRDEVINAPETADFMAGVPIEAAHQRERWGADHDAGKSPFDWFWLIGYLAQKAAASAVSGDTEKALHHTISTAAALANWHAALSGASTTMRPGIETPREVA